MKNHFSGIRGNDDYVRLAEELREIAQERGQEVAVNLIKRAEDELSRGKFSLAVLGMVKRGKSTFCNALLGSKADEYAPVGKNPVSNAVTIFENGEPSVEVHHFDGSRRPISLSQVPHYVTEALNPGNRLNVSTISIRDNFPRLPSGVVLIDTPGEGSFNRHHDELLYKYLPSVDAAIFLITVHSPLTESELQFLKEIYANDVRRVFFAINRADQAEPEELQEAIEHNISVLSANGIAASRIYPISARKAQSGNWEASGLQALFADIKDYLDREKFRVPRSRFLNRLTPLISAMSRGINEELTACTKGADELEKEIDELTNKGIKLEEEQSEHVKRLREAWMVAERELFFNLESALHTVETQMAAYISSISLLNYINVKRDFATRFNQTIRSAVYSQFENFEQRINEALSSLPVQFAGLSLDLGETEALFSKGTSCGMGKAVFTGMVSALAFYNPLFLAAGAAISLHTVSSVKADLQRQLPITIQNVRDTLHAQRSSLAAIREELLESLQEQFCCEMLPTVQALQAALSSHGVRDPGREERLVVLQSMVQDVERQADELLKQLNRA